MSTGPRQQTIRALRERIHRIEGERQWPDNRLLSSGCPPLDQLLPGGGFPRGVLVEWLSSAEGAGAETLAMIAAREAACLGGALVVLDRCGRFYPPAAAALGVDLERTMIIRARHARDEMWALDQVLRCRGVAAACAAFDQLDGRWFRRLQLAVESGGGLGLLLRPARVRGQPSWSQVQLFVQPRPSRGSRRLRVEVTRCHGLASGGAVELELDEVTGAVRACSRQADSDAGPAKPQPAFFVASASGCDETRPVHLAAQLARPAPRRQSARA